MGITFIYQTSQPNSSVWNSVAIDFGLPYFSISIGLNTLLTLLIVVRLAMHSRNVRTAMGAPSGATGLYRAIITMLIESSALYAVNSLLFVGPWGAGSHAADIFLPILAETQVCPLLRFLVRCGLSDISRQVIAPFLIIRRVANHSALTSDSVATGTGTTFSFRTQGKTTDGSHTLPGVYSLTETGKYNGVGADSTMEFRRDSKVDSKV